MDESGKSKASPSGTDGDGVRITAHGGARGKQASLLYRVLALVLVGGVAAYLVTLAVRRAAPGDDAPGSGARVGEARAARAGEFEAGALAAAATGAGERPLTARPASARRDPNELSNYVAPGQAPAMREVIERLHDAGIHSGLGAFSPPGTSPPLMGLAVPDDYVLPEGYVRHFQATDDGQRVEPILMYSPDFQFFDAAGRRITIPPDRVVPPELAPPGLAIRRIEIPAPLEPGSPSR